MKSQSPWIVDLGAFDNIFSNTRFLPF